MEKKHFLLLLGRRNASTVQQVERNKAGLAHPTNMRCQCELCACNPIDIQGRYDEHEMTFEEALAVMPMPEESDFALPIASNPLPLLNNLSSQISKHNAHITFLVQQHAMQQSELSRKATT